MVVVILRNGQRAEIAAGTAIEAGIFPTEAGANPAPALTVKDAAGAMLAVFRSADVSWYGLNGAVTVS